MRVHHKKNFSLVFLLAILNLFVACGSDSDDNDDNLPQEEETGSQDEQGTYEAILNPLNTSVAGNTRGTGTVRIRGDEVEVDVDVEGSPAGITHRQYIWSNGVCPTAANDSNLDGIVSFQEATNASGNILIPLDNQLNAQLQGDRYPISNRSGNYSYDESASLTRMLSDLYAPDPNPNDDIVKLPVGEGLNLTARSVIVHGVRSNKTLPIACGVFVRVADNEEPIPVPVPVPVPTPTPPPIPSCPIETSFSTRLNPELAIFGVRCRGGETTEVPNEDGTSSVYVCRTNQWLVTVDNVNTCNPDGACTEIGVFPAIANLQRSANSNPPEQCTFNMKARTPLSREQRFYLNIYQVRFFINRPPLVIPRR